MFVIYNVDTDMSYALNSRGEMVCCQDPPAPNLDPSDVDDWPGADEDYLDSLTPQELAHDVAIADALCRLALAPQTAG